MITREELYRLVWEEPMSKLAERFDVSGSYLARICSALDVPRPERGYWAKLAVGKAPPRPVLPEPGATTLLGWSQTGEQIATPKPRVPRTRSTKAKVTVARDRIHPLIVGAARHFEKGRPVEEGSYLKPYKKMLVDVTACKAMLSAALDLANELFNSLEAAGHRVVLAPSGRELVRQSAEERDPVGRPRQYWEYSSLWSPDRPTVVTIGTVAIGLQVVEMSEIVTVRYVNGKYIRDADYVPPRRGYQDHSFTTTQALPSGRLRIIAYSPYSVSWTAQWQDTPKSPVKGALRSIVATITAAASELVIKLEEAERQSEIRHQEWLVKEDLRRREDDRRKIAESVTQSTADLQKVIERWAERVSVGQFLDGVEQHAAGLADEDRDVVLKRLAMARAFLGTEDPLDFFRTWQTPEERYQPRFAEVSGSLAT